MDGVVQTYGGKGGDHERSELLHDGECIVGVTQVSTRKLSHLGIGMSFELSSGRIIEFEGSMKSEVRRTWPTRFEESISYFCSLVPDI